MVDNKEKDIDESKLPEFNSWFGAPLIGFFTTMFSAVWNNFVGILDSVWTTTTNYWLGFFSRVEPKAWASMLAPFIDMGFLTKEQASKLSQLKDLAHPYDLYLYLFTNWSLFSNLIETSLEPGKSLLTQTQNKKMRPGLPYYTELLQAAFVAPEKTGEVKEVLKKFGFPDEVIDLLFLSRYALYDVEYVRTLYLRGVLSTEEMFMRMRELGYTDTRIKEIIQAWEIIPGPQDLLHMVAKEAFEPDMITQMGLDDEFPAEQVEWLQKQGISVEWAKKYWYAHWDQPSLQMGFEMLHRSVIGLDELNMLFRVAEIPPYWRDKLTAIAYQPYTRVDVRRMHDMGVIDDEGLMRAYQDLGYDEEHATNMAIFTIRYNQQNDSGLTKSEILSGYKTKALTYEDALALLIQEDYTQPIAEYILTLEDFKAAKSLQTKQINNIRDRYLAQLLELQEVEQQLNSLNLQDAQIKLLIEEWKLKRWKGEKQPSKKELEEFLDYKIIDLDTFRNEIRKLGYSFQYANWYEKLYTLKVESRDNE